MTDVTGRNRVQGGVPTGGQFATEARGENGNLTDLDDELATWLGQTSTAHEGDDPDALEDLDFELPDLLDRVAEKYGDLPGFEDAMSEYRSWRSDQQELTDADDDGGDVDVAARGEKVAQLFHDQIQRGR